MANRFDEDARKKQLVADYNDKIKRHSEELKSALDKAQYDFFVSYTLTDGERIYNDLAEAMVKPGILPSEYISKNLSWLFGCAIPERDRELVLYFADRLRDYPYSGSYARRSFRANSYGPYVSMLVRLICQYSKPYIVDEPLEKILNRGLPEDMQAYLDENSWQGDGYTCWQVAYALDTKNAEAEKAVRRILTEDNSSSMITWELIKGVFLSQRSDFHELVGKLLLAARLQEGLRQTICENADLGTKEAFFTILRVIDDNNLIRFSSVKRAVGTWLGIASEDTRDLERVSAKSVRLIIDCLESESLRDEYLASEDAMKIHIALWSYGFDDIDKAIGKIAQFVISGTHHQILVAGYFAANLDYPYIANKIAKRVISRYHSEEDILAVWLPSYMPNRLYRVRTDQRYDLKVWFDSRSELEEHYRLIKSLYYSFSGKKKVFSPCVFPWYEASISKTDLAEILCTMALLLGDDIKLDECCRFIKDITFRRSDYLAVLTATPRTPVQRNTLLEGLADRETDTRKEAYRIISNLELTADDYRKIEDFLRFKTPDIRENVINILLRQSDDELKTCISRLLDNSKEEVRLGGLDMLLQLKKDNSRKAIGDSFAEKLSKRAGAEDVSSKEKILLDSLVPKTGNAQVMEKVLFTKDDKYLPTEFNSEYIELCLNTFSEYFPDSKLPELVRGKKGGSGLRGWIKSVISEDIACKTAITAARDLLSLSKFIDEHKTEAFLNHLGETVLLGGVRYPSEFEGEGWKTPLQELWQKWIKDNGITNKRLVGAAVLDRAYKQKTQFSETCTETIRTVFGAGFEYGKELPHSVVITLVLEHLCSFLPEDEMIRLSSAIAIWFIRCVPDDMVMIHAPTERRRPKWREMAHLLSHDQFRPIFKLLECKNDEGLKNTFPLAVAMAEKCISSFEKIINEEKCDSEVSEIRVLRCRNDIYIPRSLFVDARDYLYAAYQGIITNAQLYEFLFNPEEMNSALYTISMIAKCCYEIKTDDDIKNAPWHLVRRALDINDEPSEENVKLVRFIAGVYEAVIPVVLASELSRGDSPAAYSDHISRIEWICGTDYFARILSALGNDTLDRTQYSYWFRASDRKTTLSHLLSVCVPGHNDSVETLRAALSGRNISAKRLIEAALFSPEWIPIVGRYLEIDSFESVCYYFIAHMNERFDDKRKAMIARFTPLTEDELNLGAFDVDWFRSAYNSIDQKEFDMIYNAAKYISDGAKHSRARKYADAALGKLSVDETERTVSDKRNKDFLMAYALIPLADEDDLCRRYLYIQRFQKESKQFGSQRIASEGKAVEMALKNLAINAGYSDTMRLTLQMETKVMSDSRALLEEQMVEGVSFKITFDDNGKASLVCTKEGKQLKSVPAKLKKNETVLALSGMVKTLTEQYRRTRIMLERAMEDSTEFTFGELTALSSHPVVYPMLKKLVLISKGETGFLADSGLSDDAGMVHPLDNSEKVWIAHPFNLYQRGCWRAYQKYLFDNKIVQPFRQVFRELYIKTTEEANTYHSLRYAGNQIQPAKTVAALKSRRWVADIEDDLQKVYYNENIVAQIYALADWFTPADIEALTLEWVCFSDRKTGAELKIADIPDIIFSEVMRDVDLAVSVAHAGGVDPETSHSTMEMRAAILSFALPMFRVGNVRIENRHAIISGKLAEYSVHLGSGVVHQLGGAMIPVLPVHSQHRGRVFLPFVDDDPKTAEIISKVILFAEDDKIKDPTILSAISR